MIAPIRPWLTNAGEWAPVAASAKMSATSLARTSRPFERYAEPAPRSMRRVTSSSWSSSFAASAISRSAKIVTSAKSRGGREAVPAKITSSIPAPRIDLALLSPITQRMASSRLDFPQPLGPTIPVRPDSIRNSAGSTKLLKPTSFSLFIRKRLPLAPLLQRQGLPPSSSARAAFNKLALHHVPRTAIKFCAIEFEERRPGYPVVFRARFSELDEGVN